MKQNPLTLPIVGGSLSLICFFLPWFKVDMSALGADFPGINWQDSITFSGFRYVRNGATFEVLTFLATLTILGVCIYMLKQETPWKSKITVLIGSGFGFLYISIGFILFTIADLRMGSALLEFAPDVDIGKILSLQFGVFGVIIGYVLAFIGALNIPAGSLPNVVNE